MSKICPVVWGIAIALVSVLAVETDAFGQVAGPMPLPGGPPGGATKKSSGWGEAECVFTGKLESVEAGPVAQSMPPIYHHTLHLTVEKCLRGTLKSGEKVDCANMARQMEEPTFPVGKLCLVSASKAQGALVIERIEAASEKNVAEATLDCSMPLGWKIEGGKPVSPWAALGAKAWAASAAGKADVRCSKTGRPALMVGAGVNFSVEPVPPKKSIQWTNPDGDGEYKITLTNVTDKRVAVPALLSDGKNPLWEESLVILCQGKTYVCPGCKGVSGKVEPVVLKPGESVSTVVNALRLKGPQWPEGGYRIEFQFCLGEKSQTKSFYYMTRHHGPIREALAQPAEK
jgi:hypothetical protein